MELWVLFVLMVVAFVANFFSVVTGGAGLILTPVLISFGIPPVSAIAASKFSYLGSAITGTYKFHKAKKIDYRLAAPLSVFGFFGAILGARLAIHAEPEILKSVIALMMLFILALVVINRNVGESDHPVELKLWRLLLGGVLVFGAVALGTLAGGGLVILLSYILVFLFGESFLHSAGTQKIINDVAFLIISIIFIMQGVMDFSVAVPLLIASSIGGWFGSMYGLRKGSHFVKHAFMIIIVLLSAKMLLGL